MKDDDQYYMNNPNLPRRGAKFEYTPEQIADLRRAQQDIIYFAENFFYIIEPGEGRRKIKLHKCQKKALKLFEDNRFNIVCASRQIGKALALDTPVPTPSGWTTMGELKDGDTIYGSDGEAISVVKAHDVMYNRDCYKITFDNGEEIVADGDHLWATQARNERKTSKGSVKTTKDIYNTLYVPGTMEPNHRIPSCINGVSGLEKDLPIHPYVLGLWLGDGTAASGTITVGHRDIDEQLEIFKQIDQFDKLIVKNYTSKNFFIRPTVKNGVQSRSLSALLRKNNLLNNKHIPNDYLLSSREQRLQLLQGLIDSDGYIAKTGLCQFYNTNKSLVIQVRQLVESLGYKVTQKEFQPKLNSVECKPAMSITFKPIEEVAKLKFKRSRIQYREKNNNSKLRGQYHYIKNVERVDSVPVRCITVDSEDSQFLIGTQYIPTHNSTLMTIFALWIACFKKDQRILLVANKEATAIEIFRRIRLAYEELPNWLKPPVKEYGKTSAEFENGSRIGITTTTSSAGRGSSCDLLILDELAHIEAHLMKEFWAAVYPIISASKKSKILIASTPNGTDNLFYQLWSGAEKGENGWVPLRIHWSEIPGRDEEWARITKASLESEDLWAQEFELQFHSAGQSAIDYEQFEKLKMRLCEPDLTLDDGAYKIYKMPDEERVYAVGVDIAEGVGQDFSIIEVLDITDLQNIEQAAEFAANDISPYNFISKVQEVLAHYGNPLVLIERNGPGSQVIDKLVNEFNYEGVVSYGAGRAGRNREQHGMISHTNTKYQAITNMRYWMNDLDCLRIYSKETLNEFRHFVRKPNKSWAAESGFHDDRVMSIAWALMILHKEIVPRYFEVEDTDMNGNPSKIKPLDLGLNRYVNPRSIYAIADQNNDNIGLPVVFHRSVEEDDIHDLEMSGWTSLY